VVVVCAVDYAVCCCDALFHPIHPRCVKLREHHSCVPQRFTRFLFLTPHGTAASLPGVFGLWAYHWSWRGRTCVLLKDSPRWHVCVYDCRGQCYYNRYLISIVGGLLKCGTGADIREVHAEHDGADHLAQDDENLASATPNAHVEFTGLHGDVGSHRSLRRAATPSSGRRMVGRHADTFDTFGSLSTLQEDRVTLQEHGGGDGGAGGGVVRAEHSSFPGPPTAPMQTHALFTSLADAMVASPSGRSVHSTAPSVTGTGTGTGMGTGMGMGTSHAPRGVESPAGSFASSATGLKSNASMHSHASSVMDLPNAPRSMLRKSTASSRRGGRRRRCRRTRVEGSFTQSFLRQLPVPDLMVGQTYSALFRHLVMLQDALPISLLRAPNGETRAPHAYVYTNPPGDTVLSPGDLVFCLVHH